jgi:hypothetical protein
MQMHQPGDAKPCEKRPDVKTEATSAGASVVSRCAARSIADALESRLPHPRSVSYAVVWREPDASLATGKLVLEPDSLRFEGLARGRLVRRRLAYERLVGVRIGREPAEKINGNPTIVLDRRSARSLFVEPIGPGLLSEIAGLVAELSSTWTDRLEQVALVVPLRNGAIERARALIAEGPPFDPAEAGLQRHQVFLSEQEIVFVFDGVDVRETVRRLMRAPALRFAAAAWATCIAGPPRLAEPGYVWATRQADGKGATAP